jgi:hypothetical protein
MEEGTVAMTARAEMEKAIEVKRKEIQALQLKLTEKSDELIRLTMEMSFMEDFGGVEFRRKERNEVAANLDETKELEDVKAAKDAELKELLSKLTSLPK